MVPNVTHGHGEAALTGVLTILIVLLWTKFAPKKVKAVPAALVGVLVAAVLANPPFYFIGRRALADAEYRSAALEGEP